MQFYLAQSRETQETKYETLGMRQEHAETGARWPCAKAESFWPGERNSDEPHEGLHAQFALGTLSIWAWINSYYTRYHFYLKHTYLYHFFWWMKMHLPAILMFTRIARSWAITIGRSLRRCICHILLPVNGTKRAGRCSTALTIAEMPRAPDGFDCWKSREIKTDVLTVLMKTVLSPNMKYAPKWIGPFFFLHRGFLGGTEHRAKGLQGPTLKPVQQKIRPP